MPLTTGIPLVASEVRSSGPKRGTRVGISTAAGTQDPPARGYRPGWLERARFGLVPLQYGVAVSGLLVTSVPRLPGRW